MLEFKIKKSCKNSLARSGIIKTAHGLIHTPVFIPVGTKGSVKTLSQKDLEDLGAEIILANTYHLYLRPGQKLIKSQGGLHKWINWQGPILTDSGGYQVFSLAQEKGYCKNSDFKTTVKIDENGVQFKSHIDGAKHYLTPEQAIKIEHDLGADIIMAFDECAPANSSKKYFKQAMQRTHQWLLRCQKEHQKLCKNYTYSKSGRNLIPRDYLKPDLFGIVQGGLYRDLRIESAKFIDAQNLPGNAIGGLSVGESKAKMLEMIEATVPHLNIQKTRYLMGVGTPEDLLECIDRGIDMFDCVHPTRMARHGSFWTLEGRFSIKNKRFENDKKPLQKDCACESCQNYNRSYLRHLITENEILGLRLMTIHNLHFLLNFMRQIRESINLGTFKKFKTDFLKNFQHKNAES